MDDRCLMPLTVAVLLGASLEPGDVQARKASQALTPDQQLVIVEVVNDAFPLPRREGTPLPLALCLDVQIGADPLEAEAPPTPVRRGASPPRTPEPKPPILRGAPSELVRRLTRPWRTVVSALDCRLDPRQPFTLSDARQTPAQLVTVHVSAYVAAGAVKIDWTDVPSNGFDAKNSRDCTATRRPRGWAVRCGGTWAQ